MAITAAELAQMQTDAQAVVLDKPCQIWRAPLAADSYGSPARGTYVKIAPVGGATLNAGLTEPTAGQLQNYDYLIGSLAAWHVQLPVGTDVQAQDHLVIDGNTLEVHVLLDPRSLQVLLSVIAAEIK
jgi:hypothetical protein